MKKLLLVALLFACSSPPAAPASPASPISDTTPSDLPSPATASGCLLPSDPAAHIYHPDRLTVLQACITVSGTIDFIRNEADGDYHVGLRLDAQYAGLVNECNRTCLNGTEHGDLILEPVCELPVSQADAISACANYHNPLVIPPVGSHVTVTGTYVLDTAHGWTEIHPVAAIGAVA